MHTATKEGPARFVVEVLRSHAMAGEAVTSRFVTSLSTILLRASLEQPPRLVERPCLSHARNKEVPGYRSNRSNKQASCWPGRRRCCVLLT